MKTILVINDNSPGATHAVEFALSLAQKMQANILLANTAKVSNRIALKVAAGYGIEIVSEGHPLLFSIELDSRSDFIPEIDELDISDMDECHLAELINKKQVWMMIKGMTDVLPANSSQRRLNTHSLLSKVLCPLLIIPENWQIKAIERMVYIADLRYCHTQIVRYLTEWAKPCNADVSIANLTAQGLPDMAVEYAQSLFEGAICNHINYDRLFINNIREKNVGKVVDVLINGLHNDVLVLVNRQFHFEEIIGSYITDTLPQSITIPMLVFPY